MPQEELDTSGRHTARVSTLVPSISPEDVGRVSVGAQTRKAARGGRRQTEGESHAVSTAVFEGQKRARPGVDYRSGNLVLMSNWEQGSSEEEDEQETGSRLNKDKSKIPALSESMELTLDESRLITPWPYPAASDSSLNTFVRIRLSNCHFLSRKLGA